MNNNLEGCLLCERFNGFESGRDRHMVLTELVDGSRCQFVYKFILRDSMVCRDPKSDDTYSLLEALSDNSTIFASGFLLPKHYLPRHPTYFCFL